MTTYHSHTLGHIVDFQLETPKKALALSCVVFMEFNSWSAKYCHIMSLSLVAKQSKNEKS